MTKHPRRSSSAWNWLLVVPFLALAFPVFYARAAPALWGFPFFYWYQFVWLLLSALVTWIVYVASRR